MKIGGLQKLTLIDFPGRIAATVFLMGCNFSCPFCYSSELVVPSKMKNQPQLSQKVFFDFLKERKELLEGIVICGGEPTVHKELPSFIKKIKKLGFLVKLDTNGSNPQMVKQLIKKKEIDYVAMDVKAPKKNYLSVIGMSRGKGKGVVEKVAETVALLKSSDIDFEFRTTVVPGLLKKEDILKVAQWIKPAPKYFLQSFRPGKNIDPRFEKVRPYPNEYMLEIQKAIAPFFETCHIR
jgi:pyruvate formate lyase activating enzyme